MSDEYLTEEEDAILDGVAEFEENNDVEGMRAFIARHPDIFSKKHDEDDRMGVLWHRLRSACLGGDLEMAQMLVELGADLHAYQEEDHKEELLFAGTGYGRLDFLRWMLDQGVPFVQEREGLLTSDTLGKSAMKGQVAEVELLLDRGAPVNGLSNNGGTALDFALMFNHTAVADLLRSRGGLHGWQVRGEEPPRPPERAATLRDHLAETIGPPDPLMLQEIVPSGVPVIIHRVPHGDEVFLVTEGMSAAAMTPPEGASASPLAEVYFRLPADWPLTAEALRNPRHAWPIDWLRRVARMPHDGPFWMDSDGALLSATDPPKPLGPGTRMSAILAVLGGDAWDDWVRPDGTTVRLFLLYPIYPEEREVAHSEGVNALLEQFFDQGMPMHVDPQRESVV